MYTLNDLRFKFPKCSTECLKCDICKEHHPIIIPSISFNPFLHKWCQPLSCSNCLHSWFVCTSCPCQRSLNKDQLRHHHAYHHCSKTKPSNLQTSESHISYLPMSLPSDASTNSHDSSSSSNDDEIISDSLLQLPLSNTNILRTVYNNSVESLFVEDPIDNSTLDIPKTNRHENNFQYWYRRTKSLEYLMACSSFNTKDNVSNIRHSDAYLNLQIFEFIYSLSRPQQVQFSNIMNNIHPHMLSPEKFIHYFP